MRLGLSHLLRAECREAGYGASFAAKIGQVASDCREGLTVLLAREAPHGGPLRWLLVAEIADNRPFKISSAA
jgi:hypothetical protein